MSRITFLQVTHRFRFSVLLPLPLKTLNYIITRVVLFTTSRTANIVVCQTNVLSKDTSETSSDDDTLVLKNTDLVRVLVTTVHMDSFRDP